MSFSPTAGRLARPAVVVVGLVLLCLSVVGGPARAAGTGGIDVSPIPAFVDGVQVTSFRVEVPSEGSRPVAFSLRNVTEEERSARLFVAEVTRDGDGFRLGEPGSSPYVEMADREVTLAGQEVREESFTVSGPRPDDEVLAAVVLEVTAGSVTTQASTLIYLEPGRRLSLPWLLVLLAVVLLLAAAAAVVLAERRRRALAPSDTVT